MINELAVVPLRRWWFSLFLLVIYSAAFVSWMFTPHSVLNASNAFLSVVVLVIGFCAWRSGYFLNLWDGVFHGMVIFDLLLETWWIKLHEGFQFIWCAAGFAILVGGYRAFTIKRFGRSTLAG